MRVGNQQGLSALGLLVVLAVGGTMLTAAFKVGPLFMDNYFVSAALQSLADEDIHEMSDRKIRNKIEKSFTINNVRDVDIKALKIEREKTRTLVYIDYEKRVNFVANLDFVVVFHEEYDSSK